MGTGKEDEVEAVTDEVVGGESAEAPAEELEGGEVLDARLDGIVESLLFAAGTPLPLKRMVDILQGPTAKALRGAVERLMTTYNQPGRGHNIC